MKKGEFDDIFRYEVNDDNWRPTYILLKHVDHSKTIHEFTLCEKLTLVTGVDRL
jgi:DNA-directed RNA polymerase II subunit RPB1